MRLTETMYYSDGEDVLETRELDNIPVESKEVARNLILRKLLEYGGAIQAGPDDIPEDFTEVDFDFNDGSDDWLRYELKED